MAQMKTGTPLYKPLRILVITPFEDPNWRWRADAFPEDAYRWTFRNGNLFGHKEHLWIWHALSALRLARDHDLIVSHHPYMTLWVAFCMRLMRVRKPHLAFSFNHGNKRFFKGPRLAVARRVLPDVRRFWVFSESEREVYHRRYGIDPARISFNHWSVNTPPYNAELAERMAQRPYLCCMGRNNRDFATMLRAVTDLPVRAVLVCKSEALAGLDIPANVEVLNDLSMDDAMGVLHGALFQVVPVLDASTGAGHMTIAHAMQYGKAQVVTDVSTVHDYFVGGLHGLWVTPRSVESMRQAIVRLWQDAPFRAQCETNASQFAQEWLGEKASVRNLRNVFGEWLEYGDVRSSSPPGWPETISNLRNTEIAPE